MSDLLNKNTAQGKGVRTGYQAWFGALIGLALTVWNVPGVPEAIRVYAEANILPLALGLLVFVGVPAGLIAFIQNKRGQ